MARFLFILGSGLGNSNSPTRCVQFAQVAHQEGHDVSIFLIDEGVIFARKGITENVVAPTGEEMNIAMEYLLREKIPIYVCTPCAQGTEALQKMCYWKGRNMLLPRNSLN